MRKPSIISLSRRHCRARRGARRRRADRVRHLPWLHPGRCRGGGMTLNRGETFSARADRAWVHPDAERHSVCETSDEGEATP